MSVAFVYFILAFESNGYIHTKNTHVNRIGPFMGFAVSSVSQGILCEQPSLTIPESFAHFC